MEKKNDSLLPQAPTLDLTVCGNMSVKEWGFQNGMEVIYRWRRETSRRQLGGFVGVNVNMHTHSQL